MDCQQCRVIFPRKNWPPQRAGMVAFIGQARLGEQGYLPERRPVFFGEPSDLSNQFQDMPLMEGLDDDNPDAK